MPTTFYSDSQRKYWTQKPADVLKFKTVEFYHPDFGYIRLVANQFSDKTLNGNLYQAASMDIPETTNQTSDTTKAGSLRFGRIGMNIREAKTNNTCWSY